MNVLAFFIELVGPDWRGYCDDLDIEGRWRCEFIWVHFDSDIHFEWVGLCIEACKIFPAVIFAEVVDVEVMGDYFGMGCDEGDCQNR